MGGLDWETSCEWDGQRPTGWMAITFISPAGPSHAPSRTRIDLDEFGAAQRVKQSEPLVNPTDLRCCLGVGCGLEPVR